MFLTKNTFFESWDAHIAIHIVWSEREWRCAITRTQTETANNVFWTKWRSFPRPNDISMCTVHLNHFTNAGLYVCLHVKLTTSCSLQILSLRFVSRRIYVQTCQPLKENILLSSFVLLLTSKLHSLRATFAKNKKTVKRGPGYNNFCYPANFNHKTQIPVQQLKVTKRPRQAFEQLTYSKKTSRIRL